MGGGDLNMKKSWHPLLLKNQERVWLEEKKAVCAFVIRTLLLTDNISSSKRKRNSINFARRRRRNVNCRSYNGCKKNKPVKSGRRNWNGCIQRQQLGIVKTQMILRTTYWERSGLTRC
jgi:hypothetical protein